MEQRVGLLNRYIAGWVSYFALSELPTDFAKTDSWLRRRLRQTRWKEWKRPWTRARRLLELGIPAADAYRWGFSGKGYWRLAGSTPLHVALPNRYWEDLGLTGFQVRWRRLRQVC